MLYSLSEAFQQLTTILSEGNDFFRAAEPARPSPAATLEMIEIIYDGTPSPDATSRRNTSHKPSDEASLDEISRGTATDYLAGEAVMETSVEEVTDAPAPVEGVPAPPERYYDSSRSKASRSMCFTSCSR